MKSTVTRYDRTIRDSDHGLVIHVKEQDIRGAVCRDHQKCVVARAIMRQQRSTTKWVDVGNAVVLIGSSPSTGRRYLLSSQAKKQIRFFDQNDGRFAPCKVELIAPSSGRRKLGARIGESSRGGHGKSKRQVPTR
jgi:hypothetical protein